MSEGVGKLPPSDFGGQKYQKRITKLHAKIDKLFPRFNFSYHLARQEALRRQERWDKIVGFIPKLIGFRSNEQDKPPR
ncbi:hypothetical protein HYW35_02560 [Candidatus Saccharibacteria bacterium]|nr:hypothetical protein [Candidatus Saccharibacteria bacterium]